jgi:hypothetical protein
MDIPAIIAVANRLVDATDPQNGAAADEVMEEVRTFAPGLLDGQTWSEMYTALAREQPAIAGIFDG